MEYERRFVTVERTEKEFSQYLLGRGPDGLRAMPVESYAINSPRERGTFALIPPHAIARPPRLTRYWRALRPELLPLTLAPLIVAFAAVSALGGELVWSKTVCVVLALIALHAAAFTRNDFEDHLQGIDRIQRRRGSQVIQRGWMSALEVRNLSRGALLVSALFGLPLLWPPSVNVLLLVGLGLAAVLGFSFAGRGFKNQGVGDLVVGFCMGPLLTLGVGEIFAADKALWLAGLGLPLGLGAVIVFQMRQFETILSERQSGVGTLIARLGFDRGQKWLGIELAALPFLAGAVLVLWVVPIIAGGVAVILLLGQLPLQFRLKRVASPLSSALLGLAQQTLWFYFAMAAVLAIAIGTTA